MNYPERIVCLTEETTETLYAIGAVDRIVGISGFTVRPERARKEKPKVSAFTSAKIGKILELKPDLLVGFSDMQADIAAELVRSGVAVHIFNQRTVAGILSMIRTLGGMLGLADQTAPYAQSLSDRIERIKAERAKPNRPRVYFEEWGDPMITGICWVSELIGIAGGEDILPERAAEPGAGERIIENPENVIRCKPDIIIGSWCGRKFRPEQVANRPGWSDIPAVANNHLYEIKSPLILQPGPAALTEGLDALCWIIDRVLPSS
ncbi:cobalamin-binding protein [Marinobacter salarius]|jgi:iron complex transport system substrate-binding protein|uniref:cobalamin-binding protein n=1 Tax=Marinobacter salarius TaxID=1420917 RepID=UPI0018F1926C|nr:cobalamin-binding protein [Marinobacter salarius]MBJ7278882.1 cobalamin-binding protein [Marinobacter salarius]|tara:strand:+ start:4140 stop:4931 length:792 start_codon:yes stop_codon:yes gene_type:complete